MDQKGRRPQVKLQSPSLLVERLRPKLVLRDFFYVSTVRDFFYVSTEAVAKPFS